MNRVPFDQGRSDAIRTMLITSVEEAPQRARRRHVRLTVIAIAAALVAALGGTSVAVALSGGTLFSPETPVPPVTSGAPDAPPAASGAPSSTPQPATEQITVTDQRIVPHDILTAPSASHLWSFQLPQLSGASTLCLAKSVLDVSEGYALVQQVAGPDDIEGNGCGNGDNHLALSLVNTRTGALVWSREWEWGPLATDRTGVSLLGASGRLLIWNTVAGDGPTEVLDVATGRSMGRVVAPEGYSIRALYPVPGDSGDVTFVGQRLDATGQTTTTWTAMRADPTALDRPRWSHDIEAKWAADYPVGNSSSIYDVLYTAVDGTMVDDVLDLDSGAVMAAGVADRSYRYFDGVTVRSAAFTTFGAPTEVAGIDNAGNEFWSRADPSGLVIGRVIVPGNRPGAVALNDSSDVVIITSDRRLELVDGPTGETRWAADASTCGADPQSYSSNGLDLFRFPDGVLVSFIADRPVCGFDAETGRAVDVAGRRYPGPTSLGVSVGYELRGGWGTGGRPPADGVTEASGIAAAYDLVSGVELWSAPIASDERWQVAGGYVVGFSGDRMFGIG